MNSLRLVLMSSCMALLTACSSVPISQMSLKDVVLSKEVENIGALSPKDDSVVFPDIGNVNAFVTLQWSDTSKQGGVKAVKWEWMTGDAVTSKVEAQFNFYTTPFALVGFIPARNLGPGKHKVNCYIKEQFAPDTSYVLMGSKEFTIEEPTK